MKTKKGVFITSYYPGVFLLLEKEDYNAVPCKAMQELGYDTEVLTLLRPGLKKEESVRGIKIKRFKSTFALLKYVIFSKEIAIVHAFLRPFLPSLLSSLINKPKVMSPNTYQIGSNKLIAFLSLMLMKRFDLLFNFTPYEMETYKKAGIDQCKLRLVPCSIDYGFYSRKITKIEQVRKRWKIDKDDFIVVTVCNLKAVKNVDVMLKAVSLLKGKVKNIKFILIGPNSLGSARYRDEFQKEHHFVLNDSIKEFSIEKNMTATGKLTFEGIRDILNLADVYVNSSSVESQCLSAYESSAAGLPLCLSNIGSFKSVFKDRVLYHNPRDSEKLAENLLFYYKHPEKRKSMGAILKVFVKKWDYSKIKIRMIDCYKEVLGKI
ncbi:MAG: glycosyltransferase family 4 protein [Nanoarchaeota archaeon]|nr:glycosyltransferase family 4 protein [Nanoarchaeota archaeon]MBU1005607.1 glycosyltransferase family 4 protein [Nanoarchaeota archaeon]MBU1945993.1 glycosyltransferase family 4 protein [Nanoarchaeota archaeon]